LCGNRSTTVAVNFTVFESTCYGHALSSPPTYFARKNQGTASITLNSDVTISGGGTYTGELPAKIVISVTSDAVPNIFSWAKTSMPLSVSSVVYRGYGLHDDMTATLHFSKYFADIDAPPAYIIDIDTVTLGSNDTFKWKFDGGFDSPSTSITPGEPQQLKNSGIWITFEHGTGHYVADRWTVQLQPTVTEHFAIPINASNQHIIDSVAVTFTSVSGLTVGDSYTIAISDTGSISENWCECASPLYVGQFCESLGVELSTAAAYNGSTVEAGTPKGCKNGQYTKVSSSYHIETGCQQDCVTSNCVLGCYTGAEVFHPTVTDEITCLAQEFAAGATGVASTMQWQHCKGGFRYQAASGRCINHERKLCNPGFFLRSEGVCINHEESICEDGCTLYALATTPVSYRCKCVSNVHCNHLTGYTQAGFDCVPNAPCSDGFTFRSETGTCLSHNASICSTDTAGLSPARYEGVYQFNDLLVTGAPSDTSEVYTIEITSEGTPDQFSCIQAELSGQGITAGAQIMAGTVAVQFGSTTGHTIGDQWVLKAALVPEEAGTFVGSAINDASFSGSADGATSSDWTFIVTIDSIGGTDTFSWSRSAGGSGAAVSITGRPQKLFGGIFVTFGATTGHNLGESWTSTAKLGWLPVTFLPSNSFAGFSGAHFSGSFSGQTPLLLRFGWRLIACQTLSSGKSQGHSHGQNQASPSPQVLTTLRMVLVLHSTARRATEMGRRGAPARL
jgi:hypothetical protein